MMGTIMRICGIYTITNKINGKLYLGSSIDINKRWHKHKTELRKKRHKNQHLQNSWNKYGEHNFDFIIVEKCLEKNRFIIEQTYLDEIKKEPEKYYNQNYMATGCSRRKISWTQKEKHEIKKYWLINGTMKTFEHCRNKYDISSGPVSQLIQIYKKETNERPVHPLKFTIPEKEINELLEYWLNYSSLKTYDFIRNKYGYGSQTAKRIIKELKKMTNKRPIHPNSNKSPNKSFV